MTFRREDRSEVGSSRWRTVHRAALAQWLPDAVIASDRALTYVLLHGSDDFGTGWNPDWLTPDAAGAFLAFLQPEIGDSNAYEILARLRRRVG